MTSASLDQITIGEQAFSLQTKRTGAPEASVGHVNRRCLVDYPEALTAVVDGHVSLRVAASVDTRGLALGRLSIMTVLVSSG